MGESVIRIEAPPDKVFANLTKAWEDVEPGPMKVGDHFVLPGQAAVFTVTLVERPTRFGLSWVKDDYSYTVEYTLLPDTGGTQVRVEMDTRSVKSPMTAWVVGSLLEGRQEHQLLEQLKASVEKGS
jgi:hypothetical protein